MKRKDAPAIQYDIKRSFYTCTFSRLLLLYVSYVVVEMYKVKALFIVKNRTDDASGKVGQ